MDSPIPPCPSEQVLHSQQFSQCGQLCEGKEGRILYLLILLLAKVFPFWAGNLLPPLCQLCSRGCCSSAALGQDMAKGAGNLDLHQSLSFHHQHERLSRAEHITAPPVDEHIQPHLRRANLTLASPSKHLFVLLGGSNRVEMLRVILPQ